MAEKRKSDRHTAEKLPAKKAKVDEQSGPAEDLGSDTEHTEKVTSKLENMKKFLGASTESKASASTVNGANEEKNTLIAGWVQKDTLFVYTSQDVKASNKIASFDIDGTIIGTKSGRVFATDTGDWQILLPEIPGRLKQLVADGYKIVFITNQMGIEKGKVNINDFKKKVENIKAKLNVPIQVYVSTGSGPYRKPQLGMWKHLEDVGNRGVKIDKAASFYVGDAAGRPKDWAPGKKKDFSCGDRLFARNVGVPFHTPEEFFLKQKVAKYNPPPFDPTAISSNQKQLEPETTQIPLGRQEVIVMVGCPASGKSFFSKKILVPKNYVHVNRDTLKTWQKCVQATKDALANGLSVVVDNTNPDVESRQRYIEVAKATKAACRCFVMTTSIEHAKHNERFRELTDPKHEHISEMVFNMFKSKFKEPTLNEGFQELVRVNFVPSYQNADQENLYKLFLLEK